MENVYLAVSVQKSAKYSIFTDWMVLILKAKNSPYKNAFKAVEEVYFDDGKTVFLVTFIIKQTSHAGEIEAFLFQFDETWSEELDAKTISISDVSDTGASFLKQRKLN